MNRYGIRRVTAPRCRTTKRTPRRARRRRRRAQRRAAPPRRPAGRAASRARPATNRRSPTAEPARPTTHLRRRPRRRRGRAGRGSLRRPLIRLAQRETGSVKSRGSAARGRLTRPPPSSSTDASLVRAVSPQAGPAVETRADLTWRGDHDGWSWKSRAAASATCGVAIEVPSKTAKRVCAVERAAKIEAEDLAAGCGDVRRTGRARTRPARPTRSSVTTPDRPVDVLERVAADLRSSCGPRSRPGRPAAGRRPRSAMIPEGISSRTGIWFASPSRVVGMRIRPTAPARTRLGRPSSTKGQIPRIRARSPRRAGAPAASPSTEPRSPGGPQRCRSTGRPSRPDDRTGVDELLVELPQASGASRTGRSEERNLLRPRPEIRLRDRQRRERTRACPLETAATEIASGRRSRRADGAEAELVAVVPGSDHGDDACRGDVPDGLDERVVRGVGLRAAAGEVDHVHPVGDRGLEGGDDLAACWPRGRSASAR